MKIKLIKLEIGKLYQLEYLYCNIFEGIRGNIPIHTMKKGDLFVPLKVSLFKNKHTKIPQYKIISSDVIGWIDVESYLEGHLKKLS
jgi:hypothetical protein